MPQQSDERQDSLRELGDPEFFRHWAALRSRIALGGKSVPRDLKRKYAEAADEYRRRTSERPTPNEQRR